MGEMSLAADIAAPIGLPQPLLAGELETLKFVFDDADMPDTTGAAARLMDASRGSFDVAFGS